jgi:multidrug efflux pump subunit AcrA (membrane-fusion protein)
VGGVVTRRWAEPGSLVSEAGPILSVAPTESFRLVVNVKSRDSGKLRPGIAAKVKVDASPERIVRGVVTQIHETANFTGDELSVEIELANPAGLLKFGMPATVFFLADEARDGIFVPSTALINGETRPGVYVKEGAIARQRYIIVDGSRVRVVD